MRSEYKVVESYTGNGSLSAYSFDFKIEALTQLEVIELDDEGAITQRVRGDDVTYLSSVTFDSVKGGGEVNLQSNLANGYKLYIYLANDEPTQPFQFTNKKTFTLKRLERALDFLAGPIQRLTFLMGKTVRLNLTDDDNFNSELPVGFAGSPKTTIITNEDGTAFEIGPTAEEIINAESYAEDAGLSAGEAEELKDLCEEWATNITTHVTGSTETSSKAWAIGGTGDGDPDDGSSKDWAVQTGSKVKTVDYSSKEWAVGATGRGNASEGSSKDWATYTAGTVDDTDYSAKQHATGTLLRGVSGGGSAKDWATYTAGTVDDTDYSAKYYAEAAQTSANNIISSGYMALETIISDPVASGGSIDISDPARLRQIISVQSDSGSETANAKPFGTNSSLFTSGMEITLIGQSDTDILTIPGESDPGSVVQYGILSPIGDAILQQGFSVTYIYDATSEIFIEKCRNH